jgi:hypothetical protein
MVFPKILPTPLRGSPELGYTTLSVTSIIFIVFGQKTIKIIEIAYTTLAISIIFYCKWVKNNKNN